MAFKCKLHLPAAVTNEHPTSTRTYMRVGFHNMITSGEAFCGITRRRRHEDCAERLVLFDTEGTLKVATGDAPVRVHKRRFVCTSEHELMKMVVYTRALRLNRTSRIGVSNLAPLGANLDVQCPAMCMTTNSCAQPHDNKQSKQKSSKNPNVITLSLISTCFLHSSTGVRVDLRGLEFRAAASATYTRLHQVYQAS